MEEPTDLGWEEELNPESEVTLPNALVDASFITDFKPTNEQHYQFERLGFYVVDKDTDSVTGKYVFNLCVTLKDSKPKPAGAPNKSRKEEQAKQLAEKMVHLNSQKV